MSKLEERSLSDLVLRPKSKKIARPPNAFMIFAREHRKIFAKQNPNLNNKVISKMLGNAWKKTEPSTKQSYFDKAKEMEILHKQKYPGYVYSPRIARMQKLKRTMRRARMKHDRDDPDEEQDDHIPQLPRAAMGERRLATLRSRNKTLNKDFECEDATNTVKTETMNVMPLANWEETFLKNSSNSEYVPNNPEFFKTSEMASNGEEGSSSSSFQPQFPPPPSPNQSSSSSLCGENFYPDYYGKLPCRCGANCDNHFQERTFPPPVEPYWNPYKIEGRSDFYPSRIPEADSFCSSTQRDRSFYERPPISPPPCCSSSLAPNPYLMPCPRNMGPILYDSFPWQHPYHFRAPFDEERQYHQSFNHHHRRYYDLNYYGTSMVDPHMYSEQLHRLNNDKRNSEIKAILPNSNHIGDAVRISHQSELKGSIYPGPSLNINQNSPSHIPHTMPSKINRIPSSDIQSPKMPTRRSSISEAEIFQHDEEKKGGFVDDETSNASHISDAVRSSLQADQNSNIYSEISPNFHHNAPPQMDRIVPTNINQQLQSHVHLNKSSVIAARRPTLAETEVLQFEEEEESEFFKDKIPNINNISGAVRTNAQSSLNCSTYPEMSFNIHQNPPYSMHPTVPSNIKQEIPSNIHSMPCLKETEVFHRKQEKDEFNDTSINQCQGGISHNYSNEK